MVNHDIASRLREARLQAGYTQKAAGEAVGLTAQAISNFERGKNRISNDILLALCKLYNINAETILADSLPGDFSLVDYVFMRFLKGLGYSMKAADFNTKLYLEHGDEGLFPITPDEYKQLRDSVMTYTKVNADLLLSSAKDREQKHIDLYLLISRKLAGSPLSEDEDRQMKLLLKELNEVDKPFIDVLKKSADT